MTGDQPPKSREDNEALVGHIASLQRAFEELRVRTEPHVRARVARDAGYGRADEDEIVEAVYEQIWRAVKGFDPARTRNPVSWFMTVTDHAIAGYFRKHKKQIELEGLSESIPDERPRDSGTDSEREQAYVVLCEALSKLEPAWRDILLLTAMYPDMTYEEVAKVMGVPNVQAARQLKYRAFRGIRNILDEAGVEHDVLSLIYR